MEIKEMKAWHAVLAAIVVVVVITIAALLRDRPVPDPLPQPQFGDPCGTSGQMLRNSKGELFCSEK